MSLFNILFGRRPEPEPLTPSQEKGLAALTAIRTGRAPTLAPRNVRTDPPLVIHPDDIIANLTGR